MRNKILFILLISYLFTQNDCIISPEYDYYRNQDVSEDKVWDILRNKATKEFFKTEFNYFYQKTERYIQENENEIIDEYKSYKSFITAGQIKITIENSNIDGRTHYATFKICYNKDEINQEIQNRIAFDEEKKVIAVVAFVSDGLSSTKRNLFKDKLEEQVKRISPYDLLSYQKVDRILQESGKITTKDCNEAACAVDLGRDLNVDLVLQPNVNFEPQGESTISLTIFNVETGKVVAKVFEFKTVESFNSLLRSLDKFVMDLIIKATGGYTIRDEEQDIKQSSNFGYISINTTPQGATILLDGDNKGISNKLLKKIRPGEHTLVLSLPGYTRIIKRINVNPGQTVTINEILPKQMGSLYITSNPPGAKIYLNGDFKGTTDEPLSLTYLEVGDYRLTAKYAQYEESVETVTVEFDRTIDKKIVLDPIPAKIRFFSTPDGAEVYLNEKYIGLTSSDGLLYKVSPGDYNVTYKYENYFTGEDSFTTIAGGNNVIDLILRQMPKGVSSNENIGFLSVNVWPDNSQITVNRKTYNKMLSYEQLLKGKYKVKISSEGFKSDSKNIVILPKKHQEIKFTLKQIDSKKSKVRSYLFPGFGHFNSNKNLKGAMFMFGGAASLLLVNQSYKDFLNKELISDNAYQAYVNAEDNIEALAANYRNAYNEKTKSMEMVVGSSALYAGIWLWNILDMKKIIKKHEKIHLDLKLKEVKLSVDF